MAVGTGEGGDRLLHLPLVNIFFSFLFKNKKFLVIRQ